MLRWRRTCKGTASPMLQAACQRRAPRWERSTCMCSVQRMLCSAGPAHNECVLVWGVIHRSRCVDHADRSQAQQGVPPAVAHAHEGGSVLGDADLGLCRAMVAAGRGGAGVGVGVGAGAGACDQCARGRCLLVMTRRSPPLRPPNSGCTNRLTNVPEAEGGDGRPDRRHGGCDQVQRLDSLQLR